MSAMKTPHLVLSALVAAASCNAAPEPARKDLGILVYAVGGTGGIGAGVGYHINDFFSIRGEIANYSYDDTVSESGVDWNGELELATKGVYLDIKPFAGSFRITAGFNASSHTLAQVTAVPAPGSTIELNGTSYEVQGGESVSGAIAYKSRPYVGIGWGLARDGFSLGLDIGVEIGRPSVDLSATTNLGSELADAVLNGELAAETNQIRDNLELYPIVKLSVGYSF